MSEAVVSSAVKRLRDLLVSEAENLSEVEHQIYEIQYELKRMQCLMKESDKKQYRDERVRRLVTEIRKLVFKVEDVIETFALEVATEPGFNRILRKFSFILSELVTGHNIVTEINDIKAELTCLTACLRTYGITEGLAEEETSSSLVNWKSDRMLYSHDVEKRVASMMESIGRNMVKICKGLPLAISLLGGILKGKALSEWETIYKDISSNFAISDEGESHVDEYYVVTRVLALSYNNLPPRLQHCFLCFANYKEDEEIETKELYMIWMAEGLISVEDKAPGEMMLDVAERYMTELAHWSLVQLEVSKTDGASWSKYRKCRIHDLIRDFCLSKVKEEEFLNVIHLQGKYNNESPTSIVRRVCIRSYEHGDESMLKSYDHHVISHIRSLLIWKVPFSIIVRWPDEILSLQKFRLLRVFTASRYKFSNHNIRNITELVYLKYLCLLDCRLEEELPSSIGNLRNLETLDLRVRDPIRIPNVLWKLKQLKHLYLPTVTQFGIVEKLRLDGLNELELLHNYDSRYCEALDLIRLPKLKAFRGDILLEDNLKEQNVINFIKSRELRYSYLNISGGRTRCSEGVASCLVLLLECCFIDALTLNAKICRFSKEYDHTRISSMRFTSISLMYCKMEEDPMILLEKFPNLRILQLYDAYVGVEMVCSAMGFPKLKKLNLSSLRGLRKWKVNEGAMQNLSSIWMYECPVLEMLPEGLKYLSALESLFIAGMPRAFKDKVKGEDGAEGEDFYKVRHVHRVTV